MAGTRLMRHVKRPKQQQTLDAMFGKRPTSPVVPETKEAESNGDDGNEEDEDDLPVRSRGRRINRGHHWSDLPLPDGMSSPRRLRSSPGPRARPRALEDDDEEEEKEEKKTEDEEEEDIGAIDDNSDSNDDVRPAKRRRRGRKDVVTVDSSEDELVVSTPRTKQPTTPSRAIGSRSARKSARSMRQRHMELLRRRRQGEKVTENDLVSASTSDEEPALYDTDPELAVLSEFEDEEEEEGEVNKEADAEEEEEVARQKKKEKKKDKKEKKEKKKKDAADNVLVGDYDSDDQINSIYDEDDEGNDLLPLDTTENEEEDMSDFIDDSHVGLLGEPDSDMLRREIPLQFTSQAHKPLKSHFKDAVEWLVHRRLDPGGTQGEDELYSVAWDRLDREVGGLAQSRFLSSIWTPDFRTALLARPYMESFPKEGNTDLDTCHACNRSRHPTTFRVVFSGAAYSSKTLEDVEDDDDDDDDGEDSENSDDRSVDMHGNRIAPLSKEWELGAVCHSNAETAHNLLHWRRALKDWVEEKLTKDGQLQPARLQERDRMRRRQRQVLVHSVVDKWEANGTIKSLYGDFSRMLEDARIESTKTTRYRR